MSNNPIMEGAAQVMPINEFYQLPMYYTGWRTETMSWKKTAYLGTALMTSPVYDVQGPDIAKFFNKVCVNNFDKFGVGKIRHGILCNEKGQIMNDGVIMKIAEDTYRTYWLNPCLEFLVQKYSSEFNVKGTDMSFKEYFYQIAGPLSYEIMNKVSETSLDDLAFANHKMIKIAGKDVRILRLGMTGNLAYEVHGDMADAADVYIAIWNVGKEMGMQKLGQVSYCMNHTEGGFPNIQIHYPLPWYESEDLGYEGFTQFLNERPGAGWYNFNRTLVGSLGDELQQRFVTPYDTGWGDLIKFNHDFTGRQALEKISVNPQRTVATLEWNADDIMEVYGSQFRGREVEPYDYIEDRPNDVYYINSSTSFIYHADKVMADGKQIGISVGRGVSQYYRTMISMCFIDPQYAEIGKEVVVLWGKPGHPQKEIRAKVARFPYLDLGFNQSIEVNK